MMFLEIRHIVCFIVMVTLLRTSSSNVFTSNRNTAKMILEEEKLLFYLNKYINLQYDRLKPIAEFYKDRLSEVSSQQRSEAAEVQLTHPNAVYKVIQLFAVDYNRALGDYFDQFNHMVKTTTKLHLININDVEEAAKSLLRLQDVYSLEAKDMANGDYLGCRGPKLSYNDTYSIGKIAFTNKRMHQSSDWLKTTLSLMKKSTDLQWAPSLAAIRGLLGRAYLSMGKRRRANAEFSKGFKKDAMESQLVTLGKELECTPPPVPVHPIPNSIFHNFSRFCKMNISRPIFVDTNDPRIVCRYRQVVLPYYRFKEEVLSVAPAVSVIYNLTTDKESDHFKTLAKVKKLGADQGKYRGFSNFRVGAVSQLSDNDSIMVSSVSRKIEFITRLILQQEIDEENDILLAEPYQVLTYGPGGHYKFYHDFASRLGVPMDEEPDRIATFLIYLNDVERGGATVFPFIGVTVAPIKNMALLRYNSKPDDYKLNELSRHGGCPVLVGQNWIANKWIWTNRNTFSRRCGQTPEATQLDIESDMRNG